MTTIMEVCACPRCLCEVDHQDPGVVIKGGLYYCGKQCAEGHQNYPGCGHANCTCYSLPTDDMGKVSAERTDSH